MPAPQQRQRGQHPVLETVNDATKWAVSAVAFGTLLWRRDMLAAWCVLGSVVAAVNCRVLKYLLNQARPSERKADPGMPSAHGNSLGFLATFVSLAASVSAESGTPAGLALVLGVPTLGIFLAWLRVALGYHTVAQVIAGWLVGGGSAALWHGWGHRTVLPHVQQHASLQRQLYASTAMAVAFFILQNVRRWVREARQQRRQHLAGGVAPKEEFKPKSNSKAVMNAPKGGKAKKEKQAEAKAKKLEKKGLAPTNLTKK
ncbi:hypothetical protein CHLNCDRAFT_135976 [Chlorella variabilis]|uniref:Phosphatidic acid phosphatase type 2/haloperoxidase domain-containing protein n=1 Tax=Chlorella variabilis TaxID=554065 RepID=E1ZJH5_CHLVA|nr:hypothetical protein CHLNCDRAFT_135976 [Chlorella variabilis]EFN53992.1 hypothetical protein CHLNCDRAFT_135976 [Chlorella variabilis]|eukprot:XP_005846094.1 hypothetical protein CHLNCDRAFT_135976 [Chlorella variabilis]